MLESIGRTALLGMWEANFGSAVRRELPIRKGNLNSESDSGFFIKWGILYRKHVTDLQYLSLPLRRHQISSLPPARSCFMRHSQYFVFPVPEYISLWYRKNFIHLQCFSESFVYYECATCSRDCIYKPFDDVEDFQSKIWRTTGMHLSSTRFTSVNLKSSSELFNIFGVSIIVLEGVHILPPSHNTWHFLQEQEH
jgi:hypothetical protein